MNQPVIAHLALPVCKPPAQTAKAKQSPFSYTDGSQQMLLPLVFCALQSSKHWVDPPVLGTPWHQRPQSKVLPQQRAEFDSPLCTGAVDNTQWGQG